MRCWLSLDGGGTKLEALLVDEDLRPVGQSRTGGINPFFQELDSVRENFERCLNEAMLGAPAEPECVVASMPMPAALLEELVRRRFPKSRLVICNEGRMGLMAGLCRESGFLVLAGTGSGIYFQCKGVSMHLGGMGLLLGDEGSGACIGQGGIIAALHAMEERAGPTALSEQLTRWAGFALTEESRDALCSRIYDAPSPRSVLASFTPFVFESAREGDRAAAAIVEEAYRQLAWQTNTMMRRAFRELPDALCEPAVVCGGVWKAERSFFTRFQELVREAHPGAEIRYPIFEPVAGGAVLLGMSQGYGTGELRERLERTLTAYRFRPPHEKNG